MTKNLFQQSCRAAILSTMLLAGVTATTATAAGSSNNATATAPARQSRTVGLDIIKRTPNPDHTTSVTFKWSEKGKDYQRTVIVNDKTIVVYNGQLKKFSDLTDDQFHAKAVA